ncbi:MAG: argininosuccinate synthase [Phycisphaeraceae bacterium]|nr:MAG: argininosuccinate synthase [Phycisphaeraceae bacterium]
MPDKPLVVLAFSGGLDTSFCVPYLIERGYDVHTLFVNTGGMDAAESDAIRARAESLGAAGHSEVDAGPTLWETFVVPFVQGGAKYMDRYPLLCSDRYVIVAESVKLAHELGAAAVAHGCTAMGNDQFRFDQSIRCLTDLPILAPIRDIQGVTDAPRKYEMEYLAERGFEVSSAAKTYTINENVLGVTVSGSEIDELGEPGDASRKLTKPRAEWPAAPLSVTIAFEQGVPVSLDGERITGVETLSKLNKAFGAYGVGRGVYTGDTIVGLKGRIVFECPGLEVLLAAHKALEELTLTRSQNEFKAIAATEWTKLVFGGLFYEPLRADLEAFLASTQANVTGSVTVRTDGGACLAVAVDTSNALMDDKAVYAQKAAWSAADAEGFIKIAGNSSALGAAAASKRGGAAANTVLKELKAAAGVNA